MLRTSRHPAVPWSSLPTDRIQYNVQNKGRLLQRTLVGYLSHVIEEFPVDPLQIYEVVVAANSAMRDIFFGLNVESIGQKPFHSIREIEVAQGLRETTTVETTAGKLRLPINPEARVVGLPIIGCHVGADAAACLLAIDVENQNQPVLMMDIAAMMLRMVILWVRCGLDRFRYR